MECGWEIHGNPRESLKGPGVKFLDSTFRRSDQRAKISDCHLLETDTHRFGEAETLTRLPVQYRAEQSTAAQSIRVRCGSTLPGCVGFHHQQLVKGPRGVHRTRKSAQQWPHDAVPSFEPCASVASEMSLFGTEASWKKRRRPMHTALAALTLDTMGLACSGSSVQFAGSTFRYANTWHLLGALPYLECRGRRPSTYSHFEGSFHCSVDDVASRYLNIPS